MTESSFLNGEVFSTYYKSYTCSETLRTCVFGDIRTIYLSCSISFHDRNPGGKQASQRKDRRWRNQRENWSPFFDYIFILNQELSWKTAEDSVKKLSLDCLWKTIEEWFKATIYTEP